MDNLLAHNENLTLELVKTNASLAEMLLERTVHMIFERDFMNACRGLFHEFDQVRPPPARLPPAH